MSCFLNTFHYCSRKWRATLAQVLITVSFLEHASSHHGEVAPDVPEILHGVEVSEAGQ